MNGYLMQEQQWIPGEDLFVESFSPENSYGVVFEDDGQTAYFYAVERDKEGAGLRVLDALHIQETGDEPEEDEEDEDLADGNVADGGEGDGKDDEEDYDDENDDDDENEADDEGEADEDDDADSEEEPEINGNVADGQPPGGVKPNRLQIVWSHDWMKSALVIDGFCHALFNFETHGGYNINEFPPPNQIWTQGDRKLSDDMMRQLF
jgi:hypothetical protein